MNNNLINSILTEKWIEKGLEIYKEANVGGSRERLENEAREIMRAEKDATIIIKYLKGDFLAWMRSRNSREKFLGMVVCNEEEFIDIVEKTQRKGESYDVKGELIRLCRLPGIGPVLATAIVTLCNPEDYGIVSCYSINALKQIYPEKEWKLRSVDDALAALNCMMKMRNLINGRSKGKAWRVRDIDMALWGHGYEQLKN